jgi:hypothetical protein
MFQQITQSTLVQYLVRAALLSVYYPLVGDAAARMHGAAHGVLLSTSHGASRTRASGRQAPDGSAYQEQMQNWKFSLSPIRKRGRPSYDTLDPWMQDLNARVAPLLSSWSHRGRTLKG